MKKKRVHHKKKRYYKKKTRKVYRHGQHQTGKSNLRRDRQRKAKPPGKRRSKTGKTYYEYRKNRTDRKGKWV